MKGWSSHHIKNLPPGMVVDYKKPTGVIEVISNGKVETVKVRKKMVYEESELQQNCIKTFRLLYPKLWMKMYAVPNGGKRDSKEAERLRDEGVLPGVLDLNFDMPAGKWHGMKIEVKTATGRLSDYQIAFIKDKQEHYYCCVIRSVEEFLKEVNYYLSLNTGKGQT